MRGPRKLSSLLTAAAMLALLGAAQPMSSHTHVVKLMDYDDETDVLAGYPNGQPPLGWYQRTAQTRHTAAVIGPFFPPNPCRGLSIAWNALLRQIQLSEQAAAGELQADDRPAFGRLLLRLAQHQCNVEITSDTSSNPEAIDEIHPVP
jgi:hypothetical protein